MGIQRLISLILLAIALYFLGQDAASLITGTGSSPQPLATVWNRFDPVSLQSFENFVVQHTFPGLWDPGMTTLLRMPAWTLPLGFGLALLGADIFAQRRGQ